MNLRLGALSVALAGALALAQTPASTPAPGPQPAASASMRPVLPDLDRLQAAASQANLDIGRIRIDKWKADGDSKRQAQSNADSLQRNLTSALPGLIDAVRTAPQDLSAGFKLYRNLNAVYNVFESLTESAGAFGPKGDYEELARQLETVDTVRRDLGDALEQMTSSTQSELNQLRSQVRAYQQTAAAVPPAAPPKKVVVDDTEPVKKTVHKKKAAVTDASKPTESTGASPPKP